ncbi:uncharacterized protein LOC116241937 [Phasianus colchicus]|uniref:uncharacterized protein LOC116241937 n=1 Tax=Phasianus colchicus TaxID=9054 RepID=UPI00129EB674|nr:uncharacterized protein LOC116241937 [Phasianus colchicus]
MAHVRGNTALPTSQCPQAEPRCPLPSAGYPAAHPPHCLSLSTPGVTSNPPEAPREAPVRPPDSPRRQAPSLHRSPSHLLYPPYGRHHLARDHVSGVFKRPSLIGAFPGRRSTAASDWLLRVAGGGSAAGPARVARGGGWRRRWRRFLHGDGAERDPAAGGPDAGTPPSGARSLPWGEVEFSGKREREGERLTSMPTSCASEWETLD